MGLSERGGVMGAITKQYLLEKSRVPFQSKGELKLALMNHDYNYLLEKSRVPFQSKGERSYRVLYRLIAPLCQTCPNE